MKFQIYYLKIFLTEYKNLNPWFVWPDCATVENRNTRLNPKFKEFCLGDRTLIILEKRVYIKSLKTCCMLTPSTIVTNHLWSIRPQKTCILRDLSHKKVMLGTFDPNSLRTFFYLFDTSAQWNQEDRSRKTCWHHPCMYRHVDKGG